MSETKHLRGGGGFKVVKILAWGLMRRLPSFRGDVGSNIHQGLRQIYFSHSWRDLFKFKRFLLIPAQFRPSMLIVTSILMDPWIRFDKLQGFCHLLLKIFTFLIFLWEAMTKLISLEKSALLFSLPCLLLDIQRVVCLFRLFHLQLKSPKLL